MEPGGPIFLSKTYTFNNVYANFYNEISFLNEWSTLHMRLFPSSFNLLGLPRTNQLILLTYLTAVIELGKFHIKQ